MPWVRIDEEFTQHPKLMKVGPLGIALQVAALCYCNKNLTNGFIPWAAARTLLSWEFLGPEDSQGRKRCRIAITSGMSGEDVTTDFVIQMLLEAGVWHEVDGGYVIHDYLDYQPSREEVLAEREQKRQAGRKGGQAAAQARAQAGAKAPAKARAQAHAQAPVQARARAPAQAPAQAESKPVPVPISASVQSAQSERKTKSVVVAGKGSGERGTRKLSLARPPSADADSPPPAASPSPSEQQLLSLLKSVPGYPFDETRDLQFVRQLAEEFPDVNLPAEIQAWRTRKFDEPLDHKSKPRSQLRNWIIKAREFRQRDAPPEDDQSRNPIYRDLTEEALREAAEAGLLEPEDEP